MVESTSFLENATWVSWRTVTMEKMKLIIFLFFSVCQAPFISNKSVCCSEHSLADVKDQESMRWRLGFGYSLGVPGATCGTLETYRPTGDKGPLVAHLQHAAVGWRSMAWCGNSYFFKWASPPFPHLGRNLFASDLEGECLQAEWTGEEKSGQSQINSTAVIRKLSTVVLVLTHSRSSDLIGSRLDLHMHLETPKVWEFGNSHLEFSS